MFFVTDFQDFDDVPTGIPDFWPSGPSDAGPGDKQHHRDNGAEMRLDSPGIPFVRKPETL